MQQGNKNNIRNFCSIVEVNQNINPAILFPNTIAKENTEMNWPRENVGEHLLMYTEVVERMILMQVRLSVRHKD